MWQQEKMAQSVVEMQNTGLERYKRTNKVLEHFAKVGNSLSSAFSNYNDAVGSVESRFMIHLDKIKETGGTMIQDEIQPLTPIETTIRPLMKKIGSV